MYPRLRFPNKVLLRAQWGGRQDPMATQVGMVWDSWQRLAAHGGFLALPWNRVADRPSGMTPISTVEVLGAYMESTFERKDRTPSYMFAQGEPQWRDDAPPQMTMSARLAHFRGSDRMTANQVFVELGSSVGREGQIVTSLPAAWLLSIGTGLVTDLVDAFHPDAASLDCSQLVKAPGRPRFSYPVMGFVSWLSDAVVDPSRLPDAPIRRRYGEGTLIGVDPGSADPLADAIGLADRVYQAGVLSMVPFVQGQPNPVA